MSWAALNLPASANIFLRTAIPSARNPSSMRARPCRKRAFFACSDSGCSALRRENAASAFFTFSSRCAGSSVLIVDQSVPICRRIAGAPSALGNFTRMSS